MVTESDSLNTIELKNIVILPNTFSESKIFKTKEYYKEDLKQKVLKRI